MALAFLRTPLEERKRRLFATTPVPQSILMCKLQKRVSFFIEDYVQNTLPILTRLAGSQNLPLETKYDAGNPKNTKDEISTTESERLQRSFCRYELYCLLFAQCSGEYVDCQWHRKMIPAQQQTELFLLKLRPFEIAELHCVRDYLDRRLRVVFEQVEDAAVRYPKPEYFDQGFRCATGRKSCPWPFRYCGTSALEGHIEHIMTLGLLYLWRVLEATGDERRDLILHGADTCCDGISDRDFITEALGLLGLDHRSLGVGFIR